MFSLPKKDEFYVRDSTVPNDQGCQGRSAFSLKMDDGKSCKPYTYHTYQSSWPLLMFSLCGYSLLYQSVVDVFFLLMATLLCPPPVLFVALVPPIKSFDAIEAPSKPSTWKALRSVRPRAMRFAVALLLRREARELWSNRIHPSHQHQNIGGIYMYIPGIRGINGGINGGIQ